MRPLAPSFSIGSAGNEDNHKISSSNFGQIGQGTAELAALERLEKFL